jgi:type VI secretion system secreted protein Hcp
MAAVKMFLKVDGIQGESQNKLHKGEIDIIAFSWGEENATSPSQGGGGGAGKVSKQPFRFVMKVNKASPKIFLAVAEGKHFKSAVLTVAKTGGQKAEFLIWTLSEVIFTSYQTAADSEGNPFPTDSFSLRFSKIEISYRPQKADGTLDTPVEAGWDLQANRPT